jgi:hypothetical protein
VNQIYLDSAIADARRFARACRTIRWRLPERCFKPKLSLFPVWQHTGKKVLPFVTMVVVKGVSQFMTNNVVNQVEAGSHEINVKRYIATGRVASPSLGHAANNQMGPLQAPSFEWWKHRGQPTGEYRTGSDRIKRGEEPPAMCNIIRLACADDKPRSVDPNERIGRPFNC